MPSEARSAAAGHVAHHFPNAEVQVAAGRLGVWLFLVTEILLFGGLFCAFAILRARYFEAFVEAHGHLDKVLGGANTVVLIGSSFTMALAVRAAQLGKRRMGSWLLAATLALAGAFLVIKGFEYAHKLHEGLLPGRHFSARGFAHPEASLFFAVYFLMTGVHGFHVVVGMGLIAWVLVRNVRGAFSPAYHAPVEGVGLYWHLVDLIWIYLFPLLYLVG